MSDYTPTTEEVRRAHWLGTAMRSTDHLRENAVFDRWLAEVKAQVWEEGYNAKWAETWFEDNPYRGENK